MKELVIIGAGGFGRELLQWVKDINAKEKKWQIKGFIDDNLKALEGIECDYEVIGKIVDWVPSENEEFALAIASPDLKEKVTGILKSKGAIFADIIHPTAIISDFTEHGEGLVMYPFSSLNPNSKVGNFVTILSTEIPHDAIIEDFVTVSSYCALTRKIHIGRKAFLASNVCVIPERKIGEGAYLGIGSVVLRDVKDGEKVFGNPAKTIK